MLRTKGKLVVGLDDSLSSKLINWLRSSLERGQSGREGSIRRVKNLFYLKGISRDVSQFVRKCVICQASKYDNAARSGLLQPMPIP